VSTMYFVLRKRFRAAGIPSSDFVFRLRQLRQRRHFPIGERWVAGRWIPCGLLVWEYEGFCSEELAHMRRIGPSEARRLRRRSRRRGENQGKI